jgi:hypothetical protein
MEASMHAVRLLLTATAFASYFVAMSALSTAFLHSALATKRQAHLAVG